MKSLFTPLCLLVTITLLAQPSTKKLEKSIENARQQWSVPGMSVAVVYKGETYFSKGFGIKKEGFTDKVDAQSQYAIASNTKAFVSAALATLVMEQKIQWDDPVRKHLPDFAMYDPYVSEHVTVRDLLCHRTGLGTFSGDVIWYKSERPASEVVQKVAFVPQDYEFRGGYGYSNLMFITAGEVIKAVTGKPWDEYVSETFFAPLGMKETVTSVDDLDDNNAQPHKPVGDENLPIPWVNWDNMGAAGGIISSVDDMSNWIKLLLNKGIWKGDTLIDPDQLNIMWTPHNNFTLYERHHVSIPGRHFNGYGLGWGVFDYYGHKVISHSGGYDGMYSRVVLIPDLQLGFVILTNSMTNVIGAMMFDLINQFIKKDTRDWHAWYQNQSGGGGMLAEAEKRKAARAKGTFPRLGLSKYAGDYYDPMYGTITIQEEDGQLRLAFEKAPDLSATLQHWHYDTWEIKWDQVHAWFDFGLISFTLNTQNEVQGIEFDVPNYDIFFDEIHAKKQ
jgi:CubicO group peptidase (beta-lactamase class C family)